MDLWRKFGDMGLLGITCSGDYGGLDQGYLMHTIAMEGMRSFKTLIPAIFLVDQLGDSNADVTTN